jgi:hypothetical protein
MSEQNLRCYNKMTFRLIKKNESGDSYDKEEENLREMMDEAWKNMTDEEHKLANEYVIYLRALCTQNKNLIKNIEKKEIDQWLKDEKWESAEFPEMSQFEKDRDMRSVFFITPFCLKDLKTDPCGNPIAQQYYLDLQSDHNGIILRSHSSYLCNSLSDANTIVRNCGEDFYECEYRYIVIEEIKPNSLHVENFWFYKYSEMKEQYFPISKCPQEVKDYFDEGHLIRKFARVN